MLLTSVYVFGFIIAQVIVMMSGLLIGGSAMLKDKERFDSYMKYPEAHKITGSIMFVLGVILTVVFLGFAFKV